MFFSVSATIVNKNNKSENSLSRRNEQLCKSLNEHLGPWGKKNGKAWYEFSRLELPSRRLFQVSSTWLDIHSACECLHWEMTIGRRKSFRNPVLIKSLISTALPQPCKFSSGRHTHHQQFLFVSPMTQITISAAFSLSLFYPLCNYFLLHRVLFQLISGHFGGDECVMSRFHHLHHNNKYERLRLLLIRSHSFRPHRFQSTFFLLVFSFCLLVFSLVIANVFLFQYCSFF